MLVVKAKDIEKLHKALKGMSKKALPYAAREGLNKSAFAARRTWETEGRKSMIVRNKWTFGGRHHRVIKARLTNNIRQMQAVTGSYHKYMAEQERGVHRFALIRKGAPMPTWKARVGSSKQRLVPPFKWRKKIRLAQRFKRDDPMFEPKSGSKKTRTQRYVAKSIQVAKRRGTRFVYLEFPDGKRGIYDVKTKTKTKLIWDMSKRHRYTKPNPMLRRTIHDLKPFFPHYHKAALEEQVRLQLKWRGLRPSGSTAVIRQILR